jgi:hypothetical protein
MLLQTIGLQIKSSKVQIYIMGRDELKSNTVINYFIIIQWCIPLENMRQPIDNDNGDQCTQYIIASENKWVDVEHL